MATHIQQQTNCKQVGGGICDLHTALWLKTLPADIRGHVAGVKGKSLQELAQLTDEKWRANISHPSVNSLRTTPLQNWQYANIIGVTPCKPA